MKLQSKFYGDTIDIKYKDHQYTESVCDIYLLLKGC